MGVIIILIIGLVVVRKIGNMVLCFCECKGIDVILFCFIVLIVCFFIVVIVGIIVFGKLGISVMSFIVVIGVFLLGVGLVV